jgi:Ca2+-binding EF-hand superfamily protein
MSDLRDHSPAREQSSGRRSACEIPPNSHFSPAARHTPVRRLDNVEVDEFGRALREIVMIEREVESAKIELALKSDFNLYDFFKALDVKGSGSLAQTDLKMGLERSFGFVDFNLDDVYMFFKRFDRYGTGLLDFNQIGIAVLPFSREYACLVTDRPEYYCRRERDLHRYFCNETRFEIQAFFSIFFKAERQLESLRDRLKRRPYFELNDAFDFCARSRPGVILAGDLRDILAEQGFYTTERELQGLMTRLDRDRDAAISRRDFMDELAVKLV